MPSPTIGATPSWRAWAALCALSPWRRAPITFTEDADIANNRSEESSASYKKFDIVVLSGGVHLVVVDIAPSGRLSMLRTKSIDFSICMLGKIEHVLDSVERVTLLPGIRGHFWL